MYLHAENKKKSAGVVEGPLLVRRFGAVTSSPLNPALLRSGSKSQMSGERESSKWRWAL